MEEEGEEGGFPPPGWRGFEGEDFKGREKRRKEGQKAARQKADARGAQ